MMKKPYLLLIVIAALVLYGVVLAPDGDDPNEAIPSCTADEFAALVAIAPQYVTDLDDILQRAEAVPVQEWGGE
jgi:hypothetical protein